MKIGVLTHHYVGNFGAVMQADALVNIIRDFIPDAQIEIVNFRVLKHHVMSNSRFFHYKNTDSIRSFLEKVELYFEFNTFRKKLPIGKRVKNACEINDCGYDLIIVGSDEVWNYEDMAYSLIKFGVGLECMHITYSASIGDSSIELNKIPEEIKAGIKSFQEIAVRDTKTERLAKMLTNVPVIRTLDPVYLYSYPLEARKKIKNIVLRKPYILVYECNLASEQIDLVVSYAKENGYEIYGAGEYKKWYTMVDTVRISPYEWAYLFKNAQAVITGTFHGTSFAIKYNHRFAAYLTEQNRINKVSSLLEEFGLTKQIVGDHGDIIKTMTQWIDYETVNKIISERKTESLDYLFRNIKKVDLKVNQD